MSDKQLIFIFLDGVGMAEGDERINPFRSLSSELLPFHLPGASPIAGQKEPFLLKAIDATLNVDGLPQSGSGQTSLFCGINYPALCGEHGGSYPSRPMRRIIGEHNLLRQLISSGIQARFFNAYPYHSDLFCPPNLILGNDGQLHFSDAFPLPFRRRISATTTMMLSIGQRAASELDLQQKKALYQDFSNRSLIRRGAELPELSAREAGEILGSAGSQYPGLTLFEYFLSDQTGHRGHFADALSLLGDLERFVGAVISRLDPSRHTVLISSDHGNIEDMSHRSHTRNPVPLWVWGRGRQDIISSVHTIAQVCPAILAFFQAS